MDTWEDKQTGQRRSRIRIIAENLQLLGGRDGAPQGGGNYGGNGGYQQQNGGYQQQRPNNNYGGNGGGYNNGGGYQQRPNNNYGNSGYQQSAPPMPDEADDDIPF